jgi:hypothetical protein
MADAAVMHPDEDLSRAGRRNRKVRQVKGIFENRRRKLQEHGFHRLNHPAAIFPFNIGASMLAGKSLSSRFKVQGSRINFYFP